MISKYTRSISCCLLLTQLLLLTGCWSSMEINDRAFVTIMLVDTVEDSQDTQLTLGFQLPNQMIPGQSGGGSASSGDPYTYITKNGETISDAFRKVQSDLSRKIAFGQAHIIVIGKKFAEKGMDPVLEFVKRQPAFHINSNLFATESKVLEIINTPGLFERFASTILTSYIDEEVAVDTTVRDFLVARYRMGDALLPEIIFTNEPGLINEKGKKWMGTGGAVIFRDGAMVSPKMNNDEMRASLWILSQIKTSVVSIESPTDGKKVSFYLEKMKTKIRPRIEADSAAFTISSKAEAYVLSSESSIDLEKEDSMLLLQKELDAKIKKRIESAISKTRQAKADVFRLGEILDWRYPAMWKKLQPHWREQYAGELPINVVVKVELLRTGGAYHSIKEKSKY
ncbi:Ger(x)C family spore germination protein [Paenibacillus anaericanus]|uniref:Ger(X)C family spore germination protein n=1 Tax=Paenibacillus anaericanus TaxID=170367 RepID=A0A433YEI8_9BACL|nr:Ger(x)C family spore germination protein [Paenibacillus anaericanus]RUT48285.1 Ger(x)C family spore germination protein [Paenibacillus anaericanus]